MAYKSIFTLIFALSFVSLVLQQQASAAPDDNGSKANIVANDMGPIGDCSLAIESNNQTRRE